MSRRSLSILLVLLAVIAIGVVWLVERTEKRGSRAGDEPVGAPQGEPVEDRSGNVPLSIVTTEHPEVDDPEVAPAVHTPARESAALPGADPELTAGIWIEGRVVYPPGTPADERVEIVADGGKFESRPLHRVQVASDGTFRVAFANGTGIGSLVLVARYLYLDNQRAMWLADGIRDVVLRPKLGGRIEGRLILPPLPPAQRNLVVGCRVGVSLAPNPYEWSSGSSRTDIRAGTVGENLEYAIDGLPDLHRYLVTARPTGMVESRLKPVSVEAGRTVVLDIEIQEGATASGVVVAPTGEPVPRARVRLNSIDGDVSWGLRARENQETATDLQGRFELSGVRPGMFELTASSEGWVQSEPMALEALPGQKLSNLVMMLSRGGRILGQVIDASGRPRANCSVSLQGGTSHFYSSATTDTDGRFEAVSLVPDVYGITAIQEEPVAATLASSSIGVRDGETVEIVLGGADKSGIRVLGKITSGRAPVAGCVVTVSSMSNGNPQWAETASNAVGEFALTVPEPGRYSFVVQHGTGSTVRTEVLTIPEGSIFEHDVELPVGRISGRVLGIDGGPSRDVQVTVAPEDEPGPRADGTSYGHVATDQSGKFAFVGLSQGTYRVEAGNSDVLRVPGTWRISGQLSSVGTASLSGIAIVEGGLVEGIELRLQPGCGIEGRVTGPDGKPVSGAAVYARNEGGRRLDSARNCNTDLHGLFEMSDLPPGVTTLSARTLDMASPDSEPLVLASGKTLHVELALRPATMVRVLVLQGNRRITGASISITDEGGRYVPVENSIFGTDLGLSEEPGQRIGPLSPGRYSITAMTGDGKLARGEVQVADAAEEFVVLRIVD